MQQKTLQEINRLAASLHDTRDQEFAFVLFLGGAASNIAGRPALHELYYRILTADAGGRFSKEDLDNIAIEQQISKFDAVWSTLPNATKMRYLRNLYADLRPTRGHLSLASLLKENYISSVMTTTMDSLVENMFIIKTNGEGLPLRQASIVDIGQHLPESALRATAFTHPPYIYKLCGDLLRSPALTQDMLEQRKQSILAMAVDKLAQDLIFIGMTPFDDLVISCIPEEGDSVSFFGVERPGQDSNFERHLYRRRPRYIIDDDLTFDVFFEILARQLNVFQEVVEATGKTLASKTLDHIIETTKVDQSPQELLVEIIKTEQKQQYVVLVTSGIFTISIDANRRVHFSTIGCTVRGSDASIEWEVDVDELNIIMQDMGRNIAAYHRMRDSVGRDGWRHQAKREGKRLYKELMQAYPELDRKLGIARATQENPENLSIVFDGPRNYLGMPYELLHDGQVPLVVRHPLCRQVTGVEVRHPESFNTFLQGLRHSPQPLRVLLIASDTSNNLSADREVIGLKNLIELKAKMLDMAVEIEIVSTAKASVTAVQQKLESRSYHIVHYAGHGNFNEAMSEDSGFKFWEKENRQGKLITLTAKRLFDLLSGSETRLFYISACVSAQVGSSSLLHNNDYLGVMDAIAQAGVPYVLGFRWYVTDSGSQRFANLFYERLFTRRPFVPERAVLYARQCTYEEEAKGADETWTSPIFIAQTPYRNEG